MSDSAHRKVISEPMSEKTFYRFSQFIQNELGIKMPDTKKTMLQARLQKRLWKLEMSSFDDYCDYLFSHEGMERELQHMINVVTTNKTEFFREPKHYEYLAEQALPNLLRHHDPTEMFTVWCAGCSTGEEPYSLAMVLQEFAERHTDFQFLILATDISSRVLEQARLGIYDEDRIESVPMAFRKKYLLRSKSNTKGLVRVVPELRARIRFRRLNFMDRNFGLREHMDIVFCRNVIIYFDRPTQESVLSRICSYLKPGGYLFTGHSETLNGMRLPLTPVSHTVYRHVEPSENQEKELPMFYLKPAELYITDKPCVVRTVLGSCLAITLFHQQRHLAAICHALLPEPDLHDAETGAAIKASKYVKLVIPEMLAKLREYGIEPQELEVKMFGGADMLRSGADIGTRKPQIGRLNVLKARALLDAQGLSIRVTDVGGNQGRKIFFYTHTGEVLLKRLPVGIFPEEAI